MFKTPAKSSSPLAEPLRALICSTLSRPSPQSGRSQATASCAKLLQDFLLSPELIVRPRAEILTHRGFPPRPTIAPAIGILADTAANDLLKQLVDAWFGGSAERAARSLGLDARTVYRYLSGERSVPRRLAMQLAAVRADREQEVKSRAKARIIAEHIRSAEDKGRLAPARLALRRLLEVTETTRGWSWERRGHSPSRPRAV